ncbi:hypothetical protein O181_074398 [Austropuccinia psidii MF-1]|uniref:Uncharacterized protein n=1 Tax=Austropuccinia psidii MF-1 TaxID=1389203 RepID=A0A9Q3IAX7_9BASI|nr:hypothetical protein [Austropuccinia psidii MF-1]
MGSLEAWVVCSACSSSLGVDKRDGEGLTEDIKDVRLGGNGLKKKKQKKEKSYKNRKKILGVRADLELVPWLGPGLGAGFLFCKQKSTGGRSSDNSSLKAEATATAKIINRQGKTQNLPNSLYVLALTINLLSQTNLATSETRIKKEKDYHEVYLDKKIVPSFIFSTLNSVLKTKIQLLTNQCYHTKHFSQLWRD